MIGQGTTPRHHDRNAFIVVDTALRQEMTDLENALARTVVTLPRYETFIAPHCAA